MKSVVKILLRKTTFVGIVAQRRGAWREIVSVCQLDTETIRLRGEVHRVSVPLLSAVHPTAEFRFNGLLKFPARLPKGSTACQNFWKPVEMIGKRMKSSGKVAVIFRDPSNISGSLLKQYGSR